MRDYRGLIAIVLLLTLVGGCRQQRLVQPGTGPAAQVAPPLTDDDITFVYASRHVQLAAATASDSQKTRAQQALRRGAMVMVTTAVVLMPRLPFPGATAVVLRRPKLWPASVVMVREDSLSLGSFESALFELSYAITRDGGIEAPSTTQELQIHGHEIPKGANQGARNLDQWILDSLKRAPRRTVEGVGAYRAVSLHIMAYTTAKPDSLSSSEWFGLVPWAAGHSAGR